MSLQIFKNIWKKLKNYIKKENDLKKEDSLKLNYSWDWDFIEKEYIIDRGIPIGQQWDFFKNIFSEKTNPYVYNIINNDKETHDNICIGYRNYKDLHDNICIGYNNYTIGLSFVHYCFEGYYGKSFRINIRIRMDDIFFNILMDNFGVIIPTITDKVLFINLNKILSTSKEEIELLHITYI